MPQQNRPTPTQKSISFRPSAINRQRLDRLIAKRGESQTAVINAAIELLHRLECEAKLIMAEVDRLTDFGRNDPSEVE